MNELDLHYPPDSCPFCTIASAFPGPSAAAAASLWAPEAEKLGRSVPGEKDSEPEKTSPSSFVVLASEHVVAFLDILPMTRGHLLVATRGHRRKVEDMGGRESMGVGE